MAHADVIPLSRRCGGNINTAAVMGLLTNTNVAAADTLDGLDAAIAVINPSLHADQRYFANRVKQAWRMDAGITDTTVLSLTTTAGLTGLTSMGSDTTTQNLFTDG